MFKLISVIPNFILKYVYCEREIVDSKDKTNVHILKP